MTHLRPPPRLLLGAHLVAIVAAAAVACSSSSTTTTKTVTTKDAGVDAHHKTTTDASGGSDATSDVSVGAPDVRPDVINDPKNCIAPGTIGSSENGIGGYCSPEGGQCVHAGTGGTATLCTGDFGAPSHEWFCTITCTTTSDCGPGGGTCLSTPFAQICVPTACTGDLGDASSTVVDAADAAPPKDSGDDVAHATDAAATHDASAHDAADDGHRVDGA